MAARLAFPIAPYRAAPGAVDRSSIPARLLSSDLLIRDEYDGGPARIRGTVDVNNVLAARFVYLLDIPTFRIVRFALSNAVTGAFTFSRLPSGRDYFVVGYDNLRQENAVMWDRVTTYTPP